MRLHRLTFDALGPYASEQVVDFDRLSASGLFLLEGPTGAGKSTVLDAVTFALYGDLSAESAGRDRLHSDFAAPGRTPSAVLEWSVRGRRLRITRIPEHRRPSKRRGGAPVTQASSVHLEHLTDRGWTTLSSNKAETAEIVVDLLGLTRAQFTQVVLLPQGEFARFLRADDDTRRQLLTKLFGTHLYDRVTTELTERRHRAEQARDEARNHVEQALAAAAQAAGLDACAREELVALDQVELAGALEQIGLRVETAHQQAEVAVELARGRLGLVTTARDEAAQQAQRLDRLVDAQARLAEHEQGRADHERRVCMLEAMIRAEPVRAVLRLMTEQESRLTAALDQLCQKVPEATAAMLRGEGAPAAAQECTELGDTLASLTHLLSLESALDGRRAQLVAARQSAADEQARADRLREELAALPERREQLRAQHAAAAEAARPLEANQTLLLRTTERVEAAREAARLDPAIAALHSDWAAAAERHRALGLTHERLLTRRLAGMSAQLAASLVPGEPCAVCGSPDHPAPASPTAALVSADDIDDAVDDRDEAGRLSAALEQQLRTLTARRDVLTGTIAGGELASLEAQCVALNESITAATAAAAAAGQLQDDLAELALRSGELQEKATAAAAGAAAAHASAEALSAILVADEAKVAAQLAGHESIAARCDQLRQRQRALGELAAMLTAVAAERAALSDAQARAEVEASAQGFADLAAAVGAAADDATRTALSAQVQGWEHELAARRGAVNAPDLAGLDATDAGATLQLAQDAQVAYQLAETAHEQCATAYAGAARTAQAWSQCLADLRRAKAAQARTEQETAAVIRLAGLARGTDGARRVALTTYVLRHWFHQVVQVANQRLSAMSAGRYELERSDTAESKTKRSGLTLTVIDRYTGERRHPASLSGGEAFFTSLALALGLADVVKAEAGGVDLDTLFIDEGFGSLDAGTLDQVMTVIDELRDRGRVVGIVSHVAELKDRVPERLEIRRIADGSSVVRIVA
jgi:exonuclease SbcC